MQAKYSESSFIPNLFPISMGCENKTWTFA